MANQVPTLKTLTIVDVARIGRFLEDYAETFRGTRYKGTEREFAYEAAARIVNGEPMFGDEEVVRAEYEKKVAECFTKAGKLVAFL